MKIQHVSHQDNIAYKGTKRLAKATVGAISAGLAATIGRRKTEKENNKNVQDEFLFENLSEIEDFDDNIFDEEYYQAYYNIDLNLAHNRAFRDNELFNPIRDREHLGYKQYDEDDLKCADILTYKNDIYNIHNDIARYKLIDTDFGDMVLPNVVVNPASLNDDIKVRETIIEVNNKIKELGIDEKTKDKIFKNCMEYNFGNEEFSYYNLKLALLLYQNSHTWDKEEKEVINLVKYSKNHFFRIYSLTEYYMNKNLNNSEILNELKERFA